MKQKSNLARCYVVSLSKIDAVEEYISSLIQNKQENEFVDFKQFYYHEDKKYDLIKDIVSFSNEVTSVDKYIVFGIINGSWEPAGIDLSTMPDVSVINDLLHTYVEPFIYVEIGQMKYNGKDLGYIKIPVDRADRPYVIKKEYTHVTSDMQKTASGIVGGFMEDIFGKELKPWQESEKPETEP